MLSFLDRVLTVCIDRLYLYRTKVRLAMLVKESAQAPQYTDPYPEAVDAAIGQFGLTRAQLSVRMGGHNNVDAALTN